MGQRLLGRILQHPRHLCHLVRPPVTHWLLSILPIVRTGLYHLGFGLLHALAAALTVWVTITVAKLAGCLMLRSFRLLTPIMVDSWRSFQEWLEAEAGRQRLEAEAKTEQKRKLERERQEKQR